jgi:hypothetical protein
MRSDDSNIDKANIILTNVFQYLFFMFVAHTRHSKFIIFSPPISLLEHTLTVHCMSSISKHCTISLCTFGALHIETNLCTRASRKHYLWKGMAVLIYFVYGTYVEVDSSNLCCYWHFNNATLEENMSTSDLHSNLVFLYQSIQHIIMCINWCQISSSCNITVEKMCACH